jgi:predicted nucleotidyltransferase
MKFGLSLETITSIQAVFAQHPQVNQVLLYGSRGKGNYRNGSDIDLTLQGSNLTLNDILYPIMDEIDELDLPYSFDLSLFEQIDDAEFLDHIKRIGVVFYHKDKNHGNAE